MSFSHHKYKKSAPNKIKFEADFILFTIKIAFSNLILFFTFGTSENARRNSLNTLEKSIEIVIVLKSKH